MKRPTDVEPDRLTGIILAGGRARRLDGSIKPLLTVGFRPIIEHLLEELGAVCAEILISANDSVPFARYGLPIIADRRPGTGALGGLYSALFQAAHSYAVVIAGDMPFVDRRALQALAGLHPGYDVVVPRTPEGRQPLHALYARACLPAIHTQLERGRLKIDAFFPQVRVREVTVTENPECFSPRQFFNINTAADVRAARDIAAGRIGDTVVTTDSGADSTHNSARTGQAGPHRTDPKRGGSEAATVMPDIVV
ncbi:MAG: molybdenum cofactor guanylyltransferase [Deltaproteobacteria bacterium]|nr:molybdenum cofactor guanylyltransferase [Candidatus Anaeroferrophillacea bacterium]